MSNASETSDPNTGGLAIAVAPTAGAMSTDNYKLRFCFLSARWIKVEQLTDVLFSNMLPLQCGPWPALSRYHWQIRSVKARTRFSQHFKVNNERNGCTNLHSRLFRVSYRTRGVASLGACARGLQFGTSSSSLSQGYAEVRWKVEYCKIEKIER